MEAWLCMSFLPRGPYKRLEHTSSSFKGRRRGWGVGENFCDGEDDSRDLPLHQEGWEFGCEDFLPAGDWDIASSGNQGSKDLCSSRSSWPGLLPLAPATWIPSVS